MPDHCHALPFCKHMYITSMSRTDACLHFFQPTVRLSCAAAFHFFERLKDKPEINNVFFFHPFARLRWLRVLEGGSCVACRASHFIELPCQTSFCLFFTFFLLVCFQWLGTLLPLMCVILVVYCKSCVC